MRALFIVVRVLGAAVIVAAIVTQFANNVSYWKSVGIEDLTPLPINFFSFFTIDANVLSVVSFLVGAVLLIRKVDDSARWAVFRDRKSVV